MENEQIGALAECLNDADAKLGVICRKVKERAKDISLVDSDDCVIDMLEGLIDDLRSARVTLANIYHVLIERRERNG